MPAEPIPALEGIELRVSAFVTGRRLVKAGGVIHVAEEMWARIRTEGLEAALEGAELLDLDPLRDPIERAILGNLASLEALDPDR